MLKLKRIGKSKYTTLDGRIVIEKDCIDCPPYYMWYAYDAITGKSVVDCEPTLQEIKERVEGYLMRTKRW